MLPYVHNFVVTNKNLDLKSDHCIPKGTLGYITKVTDDGMLEVSFVNGYYKHLSLADVSPAPDMTKELEKNIMESATNHHTRDDREFSFDIKCHHLMIPDEVFRRVGNDDMVYSFYNASLEQELQHFIEDYLGPYNTMGFTSWHTAGRSGGHLIMAHQHIKDPSILINDIQELEEDLENFFNGFPCNIESEEDIPQIEEELADMKAELLLTYRILYYTGRYVNEAKKSTESYFSTIEAYEPLLEDYPIESESDEHEAVHI